MKLPVSRSAFWVGLAWLRSANRWAAQEGVSLVGHSLLIWWAAGECFSEAERGKIANRSTVVPIQSLSAELPVHGRGAASHPIEREGNLSLIRNH